MIATRLGYTLASLLASLQRWLELVEYELRQSKQLPQRGVHHRPLRRTRETGLVKLCYAFVCCIISLSHLIFISSQFQNCKPQSTF